MKHRLISAALVLLILASLLPSPVFADLSDISDRLGLELDENCLTFYAPANDDGTLAYKYDNFGFLLGVNGFYVDKGFCYILSTSSNSIIKYKDSEECSRICFDEFDFRAAYFAVAGENIFVVGVKNTLLHLYVFRDGSLLDSHRLYDTLQNEAIEDVYCVNGKLQICVNDMKTMGFITYTFAMDNDKIVYERRTSGLLLEGQKHRLSFAHNSSAGLSVIVVDEKRYKFDSNDRLIGVLYLGANDSGEVKVKTVELLGESNVKEAIKLFDKKGIFIGEIVIPKQKNPFVGNVKTIGGTTYLLLAMDSYILVIDVDSYFSAQYDLAEKVCKIRHLRTWMQ